MQAVAIKKTEGVSPSPQKATKKPAFISESACHSFHEGVLESLKAVEQGAKPKFVKLS